MQNPWVYYPELSQDEHEIFISALNSRFHGLQPIAVSQIDTLRYRFIASTAADPRSPYELYILEIYKPQMGFPYITRIIPVELDL